MGDFKIFLYILSYLKKCAYTLCIDIITFDSILFEQACLFFLCALTAHSFSTDDIYKNNVNNVTFRYTNICFLILGRVFTPRTTKVYVCCHLKMNESDKQPMMGN